MCVDTLCMNYIIKRFLLVSSWVGRKQLLCFVQGQGQKSEQKPTTKICWVSWPFSTINYGRGFQSPVTTVLSSHLFKINSKVAFLMGLTKLVQWMQRYYYSCLRASSQPRSQGPSSCSRGREEEGLGMRLAFSFTHFTRHGLVVIQVFHGNVRQCRKLSWN